MAHNNDALYDAVVAGAGGGAQHGWLILSTPASYTPFANNIDILATVVDLQIPTIAGGASISQINLLQSITQSVLTARYPVPVAPATYIDIGKAIAAVYTELETFLTNSSGSLSGGIQTIDFPIAIAATQDSLTPIPANAVVYSCMVQVVTPYTGGTVITVGRVGSLALLQSASDNLPTAANLYQTVQRTPWGATQLPVRVSVAGAPIAGAGFCVVSYSLPNP
jgi:hypothetical protein